MKGVIWFGRPIPRKLAAVGAITMASVAAAQNFDAVPLGTLGGPGAAAFGVNDLGQVVGAADTENGAIHAFFWSDGEMADLGTLEGGDESAAFSVNNADVVVGRSTNAAGVNRAVRWARDSTGAWQILDLGTFRADDSGFGWATRINGAGQITGYATTAGTSYHAFLWTNGTMTDLGTLHFAGQFAYSQGLGLNNAGQTVGFAYATFQGPEHGFFHNGTQQLDITPQEQFGLAQGHNINDAGLVAGYVSSTQTSGAVRAGVYDPASQSWGLIDPVADTANGYAYDINNAGDVVGTSFRLDFPSVFRGFYYAGSSVADLNDITSGAPGTITDAADISDTGFIAATADGPDGSVALLLRPAAACPGDLDADAAVGLGDLTLLLSHFGTIDGAQSRDGDMDADGDVDLSDLTAFLANFGVVCG